MHSVKKILRSFLPAPLASLYHLSLAYLGALLYGFPSKKLLVVAVTGTKGKSSTVEYLNAVLEEAGYTTALINTIRIKTASASEENPVGRSMPGRFFIQRFLRRALRAGCTAAVLEMTSEGAAQHRHRALALDALVFTNLAPEHIESHGSLSAYKDAKFEIAKQLVRSPKRPRLIVANSEDPESGRYLALPVEKRAPFSLTKSTPWRAFERNGYFTLDGMEITVRQPGEFSLRNALAAATAARALGVATPTVARGIAEVANIPGRAEAVEAGQDFLVVVDYAHTPDSLQALCESYGSRRKICVFGSAGGGRDRWKRPVMGEVAERYCAQVILTSDEPYDEDPRTIAEEIAGGMDKKPEIILDRREAIRRGLALAAGGDAVLIMGLGRSSIGGPGGAKIPWDDVAVAREELEKLSRAKGL